MERQALRGGSESVPPIYGAVANDAGGGAGCGAWWEPGGGGSPGVGTWELENGGKRPAFDSPQTFFLECNMNTL